MLSTGVVCAVASSGPRSGDCAGGGVWADGGSTETPSPPPSPAELSSALAS